MTAGVGGMCCWGGLLMGPGCWIVPGGCQFFCWKAVSRNSLLNACTASSLVEDVFCSFGRGSGETLDSEYVVEDD